MSSSDDEMPALQSDHGPSRGDSSHRVGAEGGGTGDGSVFAESTSGGLGRMSNQTSTFSNDFVDEYVAPAKKAEQITKETQTGVAWRVAADQGSQRDSSTERVVNLDDLSIGVEHENFGWLSVNEVVPNSQQQQQDDAHVDAHLSFTIPPVPGASALSQVQSALMFKGVPLPPNDLSYCFLTPGVPTQSMFVSARTYQSVITGRSSRYIAAAQDVARSLVHGESAVAANSSSSNSRSATLNSIGAHVQPAASQDTNHHNALFPRADVFSTFDAVASHLAPRGALKTFVSSSSVSARPRQELQGTPSPASQLVTQQQVPTTQRYRQQLQQEKEEREQKLKEYRASRLVLDQTTATLDEPLFDGGGDGKKGKKGGGKSMNGKGPATCTISNLVGGGKTMSVDCGFDKIDHLVYATKCSFRNGGECILPGGKLMTAADLVAMGKDPSNLSDDFIKKLITSHADATKRSDNVLKQLQALGTAAAASRRQKKK